MLKRILVIIGLAVLATACSNAPRTVSHQVISENDDIQLTGLINNLEKDNRTGIFHKVRTNRSSALMGDKALASVYNEWVGTRYRMGGTTKRGIELPRSTAEQRHLGRKIIKKGDLVFFRKNNHVGVYIGNNQFMHASTGQGVTISSLNEKYWARIYTQSRRIM
ncbi:TPA: NlpC/P60 family protein [Haemophilus influenzae]|uniref:NlpC/P60 family protein n=1 Tax=Haemophilus influenzae TaxID=727 RepID=UPI000D786A88|nr:NlpC/P60 family protein [Haemophilus influenzae]BBF05398.1 putative endopeptidase NlpC [Haemophilus influenzae]GBK73390.1 putative endopeptidase NlpC [Haemophilus influenzae]